MAEKSAVECVPLDNLAQVLSWKNYNNEWSQYVRPVAATADYCVSGLQKCHTSVLHPQSRCLRSTVPRTLVCHDMKGGYLEDRFLMDSFKHDGYRFFHWTAIDVFVYFSHHFVTIPPVGWINAGHLHGVKVLGTVITEWKSGEKIWQDILNSEYTWQALAKALCDICHYYNFDGYLLNIENIIVPELMERFEKFVDFFVETLHNTVNTAEIIWYDSVTKEGKLDWQNELNSLNRIFFDKCDGIFLNYTWTEQHLQNTVKNAGIRGYDVYVGVDVFGRNFYGGGGFQTRKAFELIRKHNLSAAVFAQAWVHECFKQTDLFVHREYAFWQTLWPYLFVHGPSELPFSTSFCQGCGHKYFYEGKLVSESSWYNLCRQQYQPCVTTCLNHGYTVTAEEQAKNDGEDLLTKNTGCMSYYADDAFHGGGCLLIRPSFTASIAEKGAETESTSVNHEKENQSDNKEASSVNEQSTSAISSFNKSDSDKIEDTTVEASPGEDKTIIKNEELIQTSNSIPKILESFYKRLLVCQFQWCGLILVSVAVKDITYFNAKLDILLLIQENSGKYSMKELLDTYSSHSTDETIFPYPQPDILSERIFEMFGRNLPKSDENSDWRVNHYLFPIDGVIQEIGARMKEPRKDILLGYLSIYPYGRRYTL